MWERIRTLISPPVFAGDEEKTNAARLLNTLLWVVIISAAVFAVINFFIDRNLTAIVFLLA